MLGFKFWKLAVPAVLVAALHAGRLEASPIGYAYAQQQISNVTITSNTSGVTITPVTLPGSSGPLVTNAGDGASISGMPGQANSDLTDPLLAQVGSAPRDVENDFSKYAPFATPSPQSTNAIPSSTASFTRGDALITLGTGANANVVAESYNNTPNASSTHGTSSYSANYTFNVSAPTTLNFGYRFVNDVFSTSIGGGASQANFSFDVTLTDNSTGRVIQDFSNPNVNVSISAPPNGPELLNSGSNSFTTLLLNPTTTYTFTFAGGADAFTSTSGIATPEPSTIGMAAFAAVSGLGLVLRRRKV